MRLAVHAVLEGRLNPRPLYTHRYRLSQLADAMNAAAHRPAGFMKALVLIDTEHRP
jgi:threonine dehydrogenase-like Zn-dependent dehydrogenase